MRGFLSFFKACLRVPIICLRLLKRKTIGKVIRLHLEFVGKMLKMQAAIRKQKFQQTLEEIRTARELGQEAVFEHMEWRRREDLMDEPLSEWPAEDWQAFCKEVEDEVDLYFLWDLVAFAKDQRKQRQMRGEESDSD